MHRDCRSKMNLVEILNTDDVSPYRSPMSSPTAAANGYRGHGKGSMNRSTVPLRVLCSEKKCDRSIERGNWLPSQFTAVNTSSPSNARGHAPNFPITSSLSKNYKRTTHNHRSYNSSYPTQAHACNTSPTHHQIFSSPLSRSSFILATDLSSSPQSVGTTSQQMSAHDRHNSLSSTISEQSEMLPALQSMCR